MLQKQKFAFLDLNLGDQDENWVSVLCRVSVCVSVCVSCVCRVCVWNQSKVWYSASLSCRSLSFRRCGSSFRHCFGGFGFWFRVSVRVRARSVRHGFRGGTPLHRRVWLSSAAVIVFGVNFILAKLNTYRGKFSRLLERMRLGVDVENRCQPFWIKSGVLMLHSAISCGIRRNSFRLA